LPSLRPRCVGICDRVFDGVFFLEGVSLFCVRTIRNDT